MPPGHEFVGGLLVVSWSCLVRALLSRLSIGSFSFPMLSGQGLGVSSMPSSSSRGPGTLVLRVAGYLLRQPLSELREPSAPKHRSHSIPYG